MPLIHYQPVLDIEIIKKIRKRFEKNIQEFKKLNFSELSICEEQLFALSLIPFMVTYLLMKTRNEIVGISSALGLKTFFPVMAHSETGTFAMAFGLGEKLYTHLSDGTIIISANFSTGKISTNSKKLYKFSYPGLYPEELWKRHQTKIEEFKAKGNSPKRLIAFQDFVTATLSEDSVMLTQYFFNLLLFAVAVTIYFLLRKRRG